MRTLPRYNNNKGNAIIKRPSFKINDTDNKIKKTVT